MGFIIALLGGSAVKISGPTDAFATIVAGIVASSGMDGLVAATIIAGLLLILMGVFRLGTLIRFVPYTITTGFTAGIAVTIVAGQLKDLFGLTYPAGTPTIETMDKLSAVAANFSTFNVEALIVGLVCLAVLVLWPRVSQRPRLAHRGARRNRHGERSGHERGTPSATSTPSTPEFRSCAAPVELRSVPRAAAQRLHHRDLAIESLLSCVVADP
ncbi:MAG: SulP family inorganic anion transporter [Collinsella intestinalis]